MKDHVNFYQTANIEQDDEMFYRNRGKSERLTNFKAISRIRNLRKSTFEKVSFGKKRFKYSYRDLPFNNNNYELFLK
jgi:hypothetical protein